MAFSLPKGRRAALAAVVAVMSAISIGVGTAGEAQAKESGLPNFPEELACYKNPLGMQNDIRILMKGPRRERLAVNYSTFEQKWNPSLRRYMNTGAWSPLFVKYKPQHYDVNALCSDITFQQYRYGQLIVW